MVKRTTDLNDIAFGVIRARMRLHFMVTPKGDRQAKKYFVIGHPRNGTTTMHKLFQANGLNSFHDSRDWETGKFDAFSDFGQVRPVAAYDRTYPNATFILNFRPLRKYLISIAAHHQKIFSTQNFVNEIWRRAEYFAWVLRHFKGRDDFIAVNIEAPGALAAVADFCGFKTAQLPGGSVHNVSNRPKLEENQRNIDEALALLELTEEAVRGCLVSRLHGDEQAELIAARDTIRFLE
ncbi:hypothetical protein PEL8287_01363 [Roseovarius litorisediminis]|uniref:Sulfotransferase family protein n=1 Tax=Roseovarius litorisediminis TaxID=1312363 RepID=A0A1Y5S0U0_9RHOB|nr:hypothetical protein [Roseovarius litorisediminis]SLN29750.1 hypothetical protein PEL8287_01363 [Roseovarius litorisediminis]